MYFTCWCNGKNKTRKEKELSVHSIEGYSTLLQCLTICCNHNFCFLFKYTAIFLTLNLTKELLFLLCSVLPRSVPITFFTLEHLKIELFRHFKIKILNEGPPPPQNSEKQLRSLYLWSNQNNSRTSSQLDVRDQSHLKECQEAEVQYNRAAARVLVLPVHTLYELIHRIMVHQQTYEIYTLSVSLEKSNLKLS